MNGFVLFLCTCCVVLGCGGSGVGRTSLPATTPASKGDDEEPSSRSFSRPAVPGVLTHETWRTVTLAVGASDDSRMGLQRQLLIDLLGSGWYSSLSLSKSEVALESGTHFRYFAKAGGTPAKLELTVVGGKQLLRAAASRALKLQMPASWWTELSDWIEAERREHLCLVWRSSFKETCPKQLQPLLSPPDGVAARSTLARLIGRVSLRSTYRGGVPVDRTGVPLRPLTVRVEVAGKEGVPDVPLLLTNTEAKIAGATTNAEGFASWDTTVFPQAVRLDTERMLGPLARHWPEQQLTIVSRPVSLKRWTLVANEVSQGQEASNPVIDALLDKELLRRGGTPGGPLAADLVLMFDRSVSSPPSAEQREERTLALMEIAESSNGGIDVVLWAEIDSRYAGPMGPNRVWYEARGRLRAFDVWRGVELADIEHNATVSGIGEARADFGARKAVAEALVRELLRHPRVGL